MISMTLDVPRWETFVILNGQTPVGFVESDRLTALESEDRDKYEGYLKVYKDYYAAMRSVGLAQLRLRNDRKIYDKFVEMGFNDKQGRRFKTAESFQRSMKYRMDGMELLYDKNKKREEPKSSQEALPSSGGDEIDRHLKAVRAALEKDWKNDGGQAK